MTIRTRATLPVAGFLVFLGACESTLNLGGSLQPDSTSAGTGGNGGAGATVSGSTSGSGGCTPGATATCYDGPANTQNVGLCKSGLKICNADGMTYGSCVGQVHPTPENCATPVDEDCDGLAPSCKGGLLWSKRFGDAAEQLANGITADSSGNVLVVGNFTGTMDFGGGPLVSAGGNDVFVVKLNASGSHVWSKRFGDSDQQIARGVAVDSAGNVFVTGIFSTTIDFGAGLLTSAGANDVFLAKLDPSGGPLWSKRFGGASNQDTRSIAVDSAGNVVVAGGFGGTIDFGGGPLTSAGAGDLFVAKLDAGGGYVWSQRFGDSSQQSATSVAVDAAGNVLVTGLFGGTVDFGGVPLTSAGGSDIFLAKLDKSGGHLWSKRFGDAGQQDGSSVAVDSVGNVFLTGEFFSTVDFGGGPLTSAGGYDVFVAKLDGSGKHVWSERFGDIDDQGGAPSIAVDTSGNVLAAGNFHGTLDFGGGPIASAGLGDGYLAKLDAAGGYVWSKRFGDALNEQGATCVATDGAGNALVAGFFGGMASFGGGTLTSAGGYDVFVAKFAP